MPYPSASIIQKRVYMYVYMKPAARIISTASQPASYPRHSPTASKQANNARVHTTLFDEQQQQQ
jgi:hypothetical protein